jgi:putative endonuclease
MGVGGFFYLYPMRTLYVYILHCADDSFYVGVTNSIKRRLREHNAGHSESSYTYSRRPLELVHIEKYKNPNTAIAREKQLKGWSRAKKQALIVKNIDLLKELAKKDFSD